MKNYNTLNEYPWWAKLVATPFIWIIMIYKLIHAFPIYIIIKCNKVLNTEL